MKKIILALAAMLIAGPAAANAYYDGPTKKWADSCTTFLLITQTPPLDAELSDAEWGEEGHFCFQGIEAWLGDTSRFKVESYPGSDAEQAELLALGRCGAQIILRYNNDTPIADALAAEFDTACGEPPAIM